MSELRRLIAETVGRVFGDLVTKELVAAAETGVWPAALWDALEANGLTRPFAEDGGGADAAWEVLHAAGRFAAPVPVAETILAGRLLADAGLAVPDGPLTVAPVRPDETLRLDRGLVHGTATRVPWGDVARHVVVVAGDPPQVALVAKERVQATRDVNLAREPRDALSFHGAPVVASGSAAVAADVVRSGGALVRAVQIAGALAFLVDACVRYANERVQFGKPIGAFQAIQQQVAVLAEQAAAAGMAAEVAFRAATRGDARVPIAVAKARAGEAAGAGAAIAHAVHGAIGFTYEHALQFATRRLWAWRAEFGGETWWQRELGRRTLARGADALWPDVAEG